MYQKIWLTWNNNQNPPWAYPIVWNQNTFTWNEVAVFIEIAQEFFGSGGGGLAPLGSPFGHLIFKSNGLTASTIGNIKTVYDPNKIETFIKVVCKVNNIDYKQRKNRKIKPIVSVNEVQLTCEKISSIKIKFDENDKTINLIRSSLQEGKPCPVCGSMHHPILNLK